MHRLHCRKIFCHYGGYVGDCMYRLHCRFLLDFCWLFSLYLLLRWLHIGGWCEFVLFLCGGNLYSQHRRRHSNRMLELRSGHLLHLWFIFLRQMFRWHVLHDDGLNQLCKLVRSRIFFQCWLHCLHELCGGEVCRCCCCNHLYELRRWPLLGYHGGPIQLHCMRRGNLLGPGCDHLFSLWCGILSGHNRIFSM